VFPSVQVFKQEEVRMNEEVGEVSGKFNVIKFVPDDKLDQIADLLNLSPDKRAALKAGQGILIVDKPGN
jgi:hypothetical protein